MNREQVEETAQQFQERCRRYYENAEKPRRCIFCEAGRIAWNGSRRRSASVMVLQVVVYIAELFCRRVKCSECKKSWTLKPPGLVAHKHYQLCVVSKALTQYLFEEQGTLSSVGSQYHCSRQTVKRWVGWTAAIAEPEILLQKVLVATDAPVLPRLQKVAQLCKKARDALWQKLVKRAAEVLGLMECLCSAWQLEPPGLRAVVQRVVAERSGVGTYAKAAIPELVRCAG
jgi:hypothetical protein